MDLSLINMVYIGRRYKNEIKNSIISDKIANNKGVDFRHEQGFF
jgi:hypothetical protein